MSLEPQGMHDMTGWHPLTCQQAETVMDRHRDLPGFLVASSLTDIDGYITGTPQVFTEWWFDDLPLLRFYRDGKGQCTHFGAVDATAAREVE